jgi:predicted RNA-binding protein with PUA-like domain
MASRSRVEKGSRGQPQAGRAGSKAEGRGSRGAGPAVNPQCWLVKSEPSTYSWDQLVEDGSTRWDGVRNAQARNNLAAMKNGDRVLFYHSGEGREVVGVARVTRTAYPDPTADDPRWVAVDLSPVEPLARPVGLAEIKADRSLAEIPLVTLSRLSVMPLDARAFERILALGGTRLR